MSYENEIAGKLVQALLVWKEQGGPSGIGLSEATAIAAKKNPSITESQMKSIINSSNALELKGDNIVLSSALTDLI
jgi:hypothetical protein